MSSNQNELSDKHHLELPRMFRICIPFGIGLLFSNLAFAQAPAGPAAPIEPLKPVPEPAENPITEPKRVLGKILFWEEQLSSDNTVACGTCHKPATGGADHRLAINPGFDGLFGSDDDIIGSPGIRNLDVNGLPVEDPLFGHFAQVTGRASQSFLTAMYADSNFWDGRATDTFVDPLDPNHIIIEIGGALESQAVGPIVSSVEMAKQSRSWAEVTEKLALVMPLSLASNIPPDMSDALIANPGYPQLFSQAFGDSAITPARIAMAIATYERTLLPDQTPWDLYMAGDTSAMTANQIQGWESFSEQTVCDNCHVPPQFTDNKSYNIGLRPALEDIGLQAVTGLNSDFGRFKTPSLRNVGLRKALNHVGWVTDVQDSVDFYNAESNDTQHTQFTENQTDIPTNNPAIVREYKELSFFGPSPSMQAIVVDFMENALTDPRVAAETFPFDRPTLASEMAPRPLKLMSFNVQELGWTGVRADTVSEVIMRESADIVGLQEALQTQKNDLQSRLQENYDFYNFQTDNSHPILIKKGIFNVIASESIDAPIVCVIERYINYLVLQQITTGHLFIVHNSQFCPAQATFAAGELSARERNQNHAAVLAQTMENNLALYDAPVLAIGDLNADINSNSMQFLLNGSSLSNGTTTSLILDDTWSLANPSVSKTAATDWILTSSGITVQKAAVIDNALTSQASDHFPVTATIVVEGQNSRGDIAGLTTGSDPTQSTFRGSVSDSDGNTTTESFSSSDILSINASIYVDPADIGKVASIYTLVAYAGSYYMKNSNGDYLPWDGSLDTLLASQSGKILTKIESLSVASGLIGATGSFQVFIAYSTDAGVFHYNQLPISFSVTQ